MVVSVLFCAGIVRAQTEAERATGLYKHYEKTVLAREQGLAPASSELAPLSGISSDDFSSGSLNPAIWSFINPGTPSTLTFTGTGTADARLSIAVPAGTPHDAWTGGNTTARVMQVASNSDFEIEVKFDSRPTARYQLEGVIVEQDANNYVRFDFNSDGTNLRLFAATIIAGSPTTRHNVVIAGAAVLYMRVRRTGNQWTQTYSLNGTTWTNGASFSQAITVNSVGPFFGNAGSPAPAFTGLVDYFFNTTSPIVPEDPVTNWWSTRRFRLPVEIRANGYQRTNKVAEADVNFTQLLTAFGQSSAFAENSIRVVEVSSGGSILDTSVAFQFDKEPGYHPQSNARGTVAFLMNGATTANASRYFQIYFETTTGGAYSLPSFSSQLVVTDNVVDEGQPSISVATPKGTYVYHKLGGGFSSINDVAGNDWVSYHQGGGSAGEFRGIPNIGPVFHPGYTNSVAVLENQGPVRSRIRTVSNNGQWESVWDIYPDYARMRLLRRDTTYWFLYEGTPGGALNPTSDFMYRSNGQRSLLNTTISTDLASPEWAYFGDRSMRHAFYVVHHDDDLLHDYYRNQDNNMTILGFGRRDPCCTSLLNTLQDFTIGFADDSLFSAASQVINASYRPMQTLQSAPESHPVTLLPPGIVSHPANRSVFAGETATFSVAATGTSPLSYQWQKNNTNVAGANASSYITPITTLADNGATFRCIVTNSLGSATSFAATLTVSPAPGPPVSDDFNSFALNSNLWTFVNPLNDATLEMTGTGTTNARLAISVPGGVAHDTWSTGMMAPRIMQNIGNTDFEVETRFEGGMSQQYQSEGFLVMQDDGNLLRFDITRDLTKNRVFCASFVNGVPTVRKDTTVALGVHFFLRLKRVGNQWTFSYSYNGTTWYVGAAFSHTLTARQLGPFVGNAGATPPFFYGLIDYFFNRNSPIVPEDGGIPSDPGSPVISNINTVPNQGGFAVHWTTNEPANGTIDFGLTPLYELGSVTNSDRSLSHSISVTGLQPSTYYNFRIRSTDSSGNQGATGNLTVTTSPVTTPLIKVWYGKTQSFGQIGNPVPDVNIVGNVSDPDGLASLSARLNGGTARAITLGPDGRRLTKKGDFNIDIPLVNLIAGANQLVITAVDSLNTTARETVTVNYTVGNVWPKTFTANWSTAPAIQSVSQVVDGGWAISSGLLEVTAPGYDRAIAIGDRTWNSYEVTVPFNVLSLDSSGFRAPSNGASVGMILRWPGHSDSPAELAGRQPKTGFLPYGGFGAYTWEMDGSQGLNILGNNLQLLDEDSTGRTISLNTWYNMKMRVETNAGVGGLYRMKIWQQGFPEPTEWDVTGQEQLTDPQNGTLLLVAHHTIVQFGNVTITQLGDTTRVLTTTTTGNGSVTRLPNLVTYPVGQSVRVTAVPASGWQFDHWSGDLNGNTNPDTVEMTADRIVTAHFIPETVPPVISNIRVSATSTHATIRWTTNEDATSVVEFGPSTGYENGDITNNTLVSQHVVVLNNLTPGATYHFRVGSVDGNNNVASSGDSTFVLDLPSTLISDDFNRFGLNQSVWTFVNPLGDGVASTANTNTPNASVNISVAAGISHDLWTTGIQTPRIVQQVNNADFETEVKFFSGVGQRFQLQGILVQQDSNDFLRFELNSDGSATKVFAGKVENGVGTVFANTTVGANNTTPLWMRVKREGDTWLLTYSNNGTVWTTATSFVHPIVSNTLGLYSGNPGVPPPAHTSSIDYFFNLASPIAGEDSGLSSDQTPPAILNVHVVTDSTSATITWSTDEPATSGVSYGLSPAHELGTIGDSALSTNHLVVLTNLTPNTTYHYSVVSADSVGNASTTSDQTFIAQSLASILVSDDFNSAILNSSLWQFINPLGDATMSMIGTGTSNAWFSMSIPGGVAHDVWTTGISAPRIMQPANNTDFEAEVKFESGVSQRFQLQGILVQEDSNDFLRVEFNADGSGTRLFVASLVNNVATVRANIPVGASGVSPMYLRVLRVDDSWKVSYSSTGTTWTTGVIFNHPMTVNSVGLFCGNSGTTIPAFTTNIDYFFNTAAPLPEDGGTPVAPIINIHPVDRTVAVGTQGAFIVSASGNPNPSFQWQKNGINITGATDSTYLTPPTTISDSGAIYRCRISNIAGTVFTNGAMLNVLNPPGVTTPPYTISVGVGQQARFVIWPTGSEPISFQWLKNGVEITGATDTVYFTPPTIIDDSGSVFRCRVTNPVGTVLGPPANLVVRTPAVITSQPRDTIVATGQTARFTITAAGSTPISYQWLKNNIEVSGATFATYTIPNALTADSGATFQCRVTNPGGAVYSTIAMLRVMDAPAILAPPINDSVLVGSQGTFTVLASGAVPLSYQWQKNSVDIPGANSATYVTPPAVQSDSGASFRCTITNTVGMITTPNAYMVVMVTPTITSHPQNKMVAPGQTASFFVGFSGSFPFAFQWQRNGVDIPGATLLGYTTPATTAADSGSLFRCRVRNAVGEVWSNAALLEVAQPATITQHPANQFAAIGKTATFSVVATGTPTLTYQWQKNGVNISGATNSSYTTPTLVKADSGAVYRCRVTNFVRQVTSNNAILNVGNPPAITTQPLAQSVGIGSTATFSVTATGSITLAYQWSKNGTAIPGATSSSYITPAVTTGDNGSLFRCAVTNNYGTATSDSALLTVTSGVRVTTNLQALYTFNEGSGTTVNDVSGVGTPLNLTIGSAGAVTWGSGKLTVNSSTTILSPAAGTKIITAAQSTNQITLEAWIKPTNATQTGPSHIAGLPTGTTSRNALLGQSGSTYDGRIRTSSTGTGGTSLVTSSGVVTTNLTHVIYTRNASGATRIYVNGTQVSTGTVSGTFSNWSSTARFSIANETGGARPWLGELHLVAVYNRALTQSEVTQNFNAGGNPAAAIAKAEFQAPGGNLPRDYYLHQNYPNPFNPQTTIRYDLPTNGNVTLKLYSSIGEEIATLVNQFQMAGVHELPVDGSTLSSGVYFYRLQSGAFVTTKKMTLLK